MLTTAKSWLYFALVVLLPIPAIAQSVGTSVAVNFWVQLLLAVAAVVIPSLLGLIAVWAKAHFKLAAGSNAANIIDLLVSAGTEYAASAIAKAPANVAPVDVKNKAIGDFLNTLSDSTQAAMKLKGVTAVSIAQRIDGSLSLALTPPVSKSPAATEITNPTPTPGAK